MRRKYLMWIIAIGMAGCHPERVVDVEPPPEIPADYPATAKFSEEGYNRYVAAWVRMAAKYNLPLYPPPIDSALMIPEQWNYSIDLFPNRSDTVTLGEAQARVYQFIDEWPDLMNVSTSELTDTNGTENFRNYNFAPVKHFPYGWGTSLSMQQTLVIHVRHDGVMTWFLNDCSPTLKIPALTNFDSTYAKEALEGKKLYYYDWSGKDSLILSNENMTNSEIAAVLIDRLWDVTYTSRTTIEYRRAWKIRTPIFNVYVDAITGMDLNYAEQTVIF